MKPSVLAILARFRGNVADAIDYCERMAYDNSHLAVEYRKYRDALLEVKPCALHVRN